MMHPAQKKSRDVHFSEHHSNPFPEVKPQTFGERLREERARIGLTQTEMAEVGGVKRTTQHVYETDIRVPDLHYLMKVRDAGADLAFLVLGERQPTSASEMLVISHSALSNIYRVVDEFGVDQKGKPLPLESRVRLFQLLCASMKGRAGSEANLDVLRAELSHFGRP